MMAAVENTPYSNYSLACVAGCTNDGLVYAASVRKGKVDLWVHSGVQEKWHLLTTFLQPPGIRYRLDYNCPMSAALTHDKRCVDVFLEVPASAYLLRFFIFNPNENCVYSCIDAEKIRRNYDIEPYLAWLGEDCLLVSGMHSDADDDRYHLFRIDMDKESMAFTLTDMLAFDMEYSFLLSVYFCADEDLLYVCDSSRGEIKLYEKSHDGSVKLCQAARLPISERHEYEYIALSDMCPYPSTGGRCVVMAMEEFCYMFDCNLLSFRRMCDLPSFEILRRVRLSIKCCTASRAQFFCLKVLDGTIAQNRIGVPSLQYVCLQKLCETWPALKLCTDEKEAKKMGIPNPIWNRFFKPMVVAEEAQS